MRLHGLVLTGAFASCLACVVALARPADAPGSSESIRDLVYWGAGGPIRIRLHLQINERSVDATWSEAVEALFKFCDRNGDGILDPTELAPFNEPRGRNPQLAVDANSEPPLRLMFEDRRAPVTLALFSAALRTAGFDAISLAITQAQPNSERLSAALFRRLDRDGDGKLSLAELQEARTQLEYFDANEDELITVAELLGRVQANPTRRVALPQRTRADSTSGSVDLVLLPGDVEAAVTQITSTRGDSKSKAIRRADFGGDAQTFAALDKNGDGRLDVEELKAWLGQSAPLEVRLAFGAPKGSPGSSVVSKQPGDKVSVQSRATGEIDASWAKVGFRFAPTVSGEGQDIAWKGTADRVRKQLLAVADKGGEIKRQNLANQPDLSSFVDFASRKTEGKLIPAEVDAALKVLARLSRCRMTIGIRDHGTGLFELLDQNGDGQLSPRELVQAGERLKPFADSTAKIGPGDLPRRLDISATAGSIPAVLSSSRAAEQARVKSTKQNLPAWFTNMDRNGDGEVSLREFLGPIEHFRKLDKNGDGLISPDEARAAAKPGSTP